MDLINRIILVDKILHTFPFYEKSGYITFLYQYQSNEKKNYVRKIVFSNNALSKHIFIKQLREYADTDPGV